MESFGWLGSAGPFAPKKVIAHRHLTEFHHSLCCMTAGRSSVDPTSSVTSFHPKT